MIKVADLIGKFQYALDVDGGYIYGKSGQIWTARDQANTGNEQAINYGSRWIGHQVWDCSGLVRWAYRQLGTDCAHGSNSIYNRYCKNKGRLIGGKRQDGEELKPGTAVFTGTSEDRGHIGLYIGNGKVIEAKGTQYGVVMSKITDKNRDGRDRWTWWGELTAVDYGSSSEIPSGSEEDKQMKTIRRGDKGEAVKDLQKKLMILGYQLPRYGADGSFGNETLAAVKAFQKDHGLNVDGVAGPATLSALDAAIGSQPVEDLYTVTIPHQDKTQAEALCSAYPAATMTKEGGD